MKLTARMLTVSMTTSVVLLGSTARAHEGTHGDTTEIGRKGDAAEATRTIDVVMDDTMRFRPSRVSVRNGETVRFRLRNAGTVEHEFVLGTDRELAAHAEMMRKMPDMRHADPNMLALAGGAAGEVVWRFTRQGSVSFACLRAGHYDAGMKGKVIVGSQPVAAAHHHDRSSAN